MSYNFNCLFIISCVGLIHLITILFCFFKGTSCGYSPSCSEIQRSIFGDASHFLANHIYSTAVRGFTDSFESRPQSLRSSAGAFLSFILSFSITLLIYQIIFAIPHFSTKNIFLIVVFFVISVVTRDNIQFTIPRISQYPIMLCDYW